MGHPVLSRKCQTQACRRGVLSLVMSRIPANLVEAPPPPPRQVRSRKWQWTALAVFIIAMLVLAVYLVVS